MKKWYAKRVPVAVTTGSVKIVKQPVGFSMTRIMTKYLTVR